MPKPTPQLAHSLLALEWSCLYLDAVVLIASRTTSSSDFTTAQWHKLLTMMTALVVCALLYHIWQ
jgi:hypothetical protein